MKMGRTVISVKHTKKTLIIGIVAWLPNEEGQV